MTEISEAAKRKACELANAEFGDGDSTRLWELKDVGPLTPSLVALARYIQQTSDVALAVYKNFPLDDWPDDLADDLLDIIIDDDPDPVEAALNEWFDDVEATDAASVRAYLANHGLQITRKDEA